MAGRPREYFEALKETGVPRRPREYFWGLRSPEVIRLLPYDSQLDREAEQAAPRGAATTTPAISMPRYAREPRPTACSAQS